MLNQGYAAGGISFKLAGTDYTTNEEWFNGLGPDDYNDDVKKALRKGGKSDLNVYSTGFVEGSGAGLLGYATFPSDYSSNVSGRRDLVLRTVTLINDDWMVTAQG